MRHHAREFRVGRAAEDARDREQDIRICGDPRAVLASVDLDQNAEAAAEFRAALRYGACDIDVVGHDGHLYAAGLQGRDAIELVRDDANRVLDIADAVRRKIFGLLERRYRDAAEVAIEHDARNIDRLGCLHVRPQSNAVACCGGGHATSVPAQLGQVEH